MSVVERLQNTYIVNKDTPFAIDTDNTGIILNTPDQLKSAIADFRERYNGDIVVHGTSKTIKQGDILIPKISTRPAIIKGQTVHWNQHPPYIFAGLPEYPDIAAFYATIFPHAALFMAGITTRDEPEIQYMAKPEVIAFARQTNRIGKICILSATTFKSLPHHSHNWAELVSEEEVEVLEAFSVQHPVLSFPLESILPFEAPEITAQELRAYHAEHYRQRLMVATQDSTLKKIR